jgi:ribosome-binding ATPase
MRIALAGRPGAGKSALMDLLAHRGDAGSSGSGRGDSERGTLRMAHVEVPDPRLDDLSRAYRPKKTTPARLQFDDLEQKSGLVYPAISSQRKEMLAQADLVLLVLDLFTCGPEDWTREALEQWRMANEEFALLDLAVVETRRVKLEKLMKIGQGEAFPGELQLLKAAQAGLEEGRPVRALQLSPEETRRLRGYSFMTANPVLPACNVGEEHLGDAADAPFLRELAGKQTELTGEGAAPAVVFSAEVERQIQELPPEERAEFAQAFGLTEPAVGQVIRAAYRVAGLHCFFTAGDDEVRAWSIRQGALAPEAAGVIHTDLQKGFVRAEVLKYEDWKKCGSEEAAKEKGLMRLEGKEYEVQDGDILTIRSGLAKGR